MKCRYHPEEQAIAICQKFGYGYCSRCCGSKNDQPVCACTSPKGHCTFRQECVIHYLSRRKSKSPKATAASRKGNSVS